MTSVVYNRDRPYTADMWRAIQALVGADVDGIPGEQTATAVGVWWATARSAQTARRGRGIRATSAWTTTPT